ncbi:helix-turn-helix domain-containing protein [Magnetospirillum moscoviense]|uniref:Transcriptional regulator n=1 Tax=Magnetospirillum moscoviense TaxID=1437059 RepID=A0A178MEJ7_9PROT|nr:helix-turn-helix domain-containing protein [Magnetospirillum moscoviense]MBF0327154.1 helix-turn-helix transcriptional regulator [Alphaproteobacteria bacterium]OAN47159.1 transcriptional regulator [Magnetospirillum moscoviense]
MTPFGERVRRLRQAKGLQLKEMAAQLGVSAPYLSALEHGHRGRPAPGLIMQIAGLLGCIWDEAEELKRLAELSHPRVTIDTAGLSPARTELANRLAETIATLPEDKVATVLELLKD